MSRFSFVVSTTVICCFSIAIVCFSGFNYLKTIEKYYVSSWKQQNQIICSFVDDKVNTNSTVTYLENKIEQLEEDNKKLRNQNIELENSQIELTGDLCNIIEQKNELEKSVVANKIKFLRATVYTTAEANSKYNCCSKTKPVPGYTCAVSRDLKHLLGKKIYIENVGIRVIEDTMGEGKHNSIDILVPKDFNWREFGVKKLTVIIF